MDIALGCLIGLLFAYLLLPEGTLMPTIADLAKHIENMKRASSIVNKAASDAPKHAAIMDSVEQRLAINDENMNKLAEYEKLMAQMDALGNGGPALDATFQSSTESPAPAGTVSNSTIGVGKHGS
jgi:hypothetical protein